MFVRFGYCDYRCSWCDSMFAVEPAQVKEHAERLTGPEINERLQEKGWAPGMWVTLSGGNPAIHDLNDFVWTLRDGQYKVAVETQGSVYRSWLLNVDHLVVSPKPPSSGMATRQREHQTALFLNRVERVLDPAKRSMKIVVFDDADYTWARNLILSYAVKGPYPWQTFLSVGTPPITVWDSDVRSAPSEAMVRKQISERYAWLCERVASDPVMIGTRVLPQLHVIAWGHARAV
jgi:7-carboxy-7-deazaguanine synthase